MTYTYAILEVSRLTWDEIAAKLRTAEYHHAFDRDVIDMHGIALRAEEVTSALDARAELEEAVAKASVTQPRTSGLDTRKVFLTELDEAIAKASVTGDLFVSVGLTLVQARELRYLLQLVRDLRGETPS